MKKQVTKIATLAFALLSFAAFSQDRVRPCSTDEAMNKMLANPEFKRQFDETQALIKSQGSQAAARTAAAFEYTIPVVFHVLYECNGPNITDDVLIQALKEINDDYSRNSADTNLIATAFKNSYIDADIKFMLAKKDPSGNCINGIVRHMDAKTNWDQDAADPNTPGGASYWPYTWTASKYLNIYIVSQIIDPTSIGITVGYTFRPGGFSSGKSYDAIVYNMNYVSGAKAAGAPKSRSLSHEIGHWLNLAHTWGMNNAPGGACGDDGITDTPVCKGEFGGCVTSTIATCTQTNPAMNGLNNVQNIMNYSDCPRNFTSGQIASMRSTLGSTANGRNNLYTLANLSLTGVNDPGLCNPVAEFFSTNCAYTVCAGSSLSVKDLSGNGVITGVSWTADNGAVIANPTATLTNISFPNVGTSNVTVSVTTSAGSNTKVRVVTVIDNTPGFGPVQMESFENPGVPANWSVINPDSDPVQWEQTSSAAYDQSNSYMISGKTDPPNKSDILQMPIMDVLNNPGNVLEFAYAYRQSEAAQNDVLKIEGSRDCGGTWATIYSMSGAVMQAGSGGIDMTDYVPATNEWRKYVISSHPQWQNYKNSSSVMVRFNFIEGTNGYGNNMYIDAINWYSTVGVNELTKSIKFNVFPNPTTGETSVNFSLNDAGKIKISVLDVMGREVLPTTEESYNAGEQTISINKNNTLSKGVYFVNLSYNGAKMSSKLIIH